MNERRVNFLLGEINRNLDDKKSRQEAMALEEERTQAHERQNNKDETNRANSIAARILEQQGLMVLRTSSDRPERYNPELERNRPNTRQLSQRQYQRDYSRS